MLVETLRTISLTLLGWLGSPRADSQSMRISRGGGVRRRGRPPGGPPEPLAEVRRDESDGHCPPPASPQRLGDRRRSPEIAGDRRRSPQRLGDGDATKEARGGGVASDARGGVASEARGERIERSRSRAAASVRSGTLTVPIGEGVTTSASASASASSSSSLVSSSSSSSKSSRCSSEEPRSLSSYAITMPPSESASEGRCSCCSSHRC